MAGSQGVNGIRVGAEAQGEGEAALQRVVIAEQRGSYFPFKALGAP